MKKKLGSLNASPHKRLYHSIIADYTPELSIYELIDNAIDNGKRYKVKKILIEVVFDEIQNSICVTDNSGGIPHDELKNIVSPGRTGNSGSDDTIGIFGVGSKRGVISLSEKISIKSRYKNEDTYLVEYDDLWIGDEDNWDIEYFQIDNISESTTIVELSKLRGIKVIDLLSGGIIDKISKVYGFLLKSGEIEIRINGNQLNPILPLGNWSYPKGFTPKILKKTATIDGEEIYYEIHTGLTLQGSPQGKYGVTFYGNKRLICEYIKNDEVGYTVGKASSPHPTKSLFQAIVLITGPSKLIPWNSSKSGINFQKNTYKDIISEDIIHAVTEYSKASAFLSKQAGSWASCVEPFKKGKIEEIILTSSSPSKSYSLPIGKIRKSKIEKIIDDNQKIIDSMPWTKGLMESILAVEIIQRQNFEQKNRISLILIDSNLEIGLKEYLVNNIKIGTADFNKIKENRTDVIKRVEKDNSGDSVLLALLSQTNYYYNIRNNFVHQKATATVNDSELIKYDKIVKEIFQILFGFKF